MFLKLESTLVLLVTFFILVIGSTSAQSLGATENFPNEMLQLVNETRAASQVCGATSMPPASPLTLNQLLNQAAQGHSHDMASNDFFSHYGSDNSTYDQRIKAQGYSFSEASENIAAIGKTPKETLIQWMASEAHCKNIMNPDFTQLGMGMSENPASTYGNYWTLKFGTPAGEGG